MKKIVIGSDHGGFRLKEKLKVYLRRKGFAIKDVGTYSEESCDYPLYAFRVAKEVSTGRYRQGIVICKSGIGTAIVANKLPRVRASLCYNVKAAIATRRHNDSNVLSLGSQFVSGKKAKAIVAAWLSTEFEGGRHARRLKIIQDIERKVSGCRK
ncbi:MAG: ribose 5-phosphate isomerase B [Candidatus Omnitrophica bacterium]|nr:ribose 5-phosphate isomerase B [Candidatus Omnitrophota bacterium]